MKNVLVGLLASVLTQAALADLTLYTDRPTSRLLPAAQKFEALTGEKVVIVEAAYPQLVERLKTEGATTPADLLMTKDLVNLVDATERHLFQPFTMTEALLKVSPSMRDPQNLWTAITFRVRSLVYDPSRVNPSEISSYADLANAKWAGRLCLRTSRGGYNEALASYLIAQNGVEGAKTILSGWVDNLATNVFPNDISMLEAIAAGTCDVGISNHYYLAQVVAQNPNFPIRMHFLEQNAGGVHTNGTGIGILKTSGKRNLAQKFIELLLTDEFQLQISAGHFDYPAVQGLTPSSLIKDWGTFKADSRTWSEIGTHLPAARQIFSEIGYK